MREDLIASIRPAGTAPSSAKMIIRGSLGDAVTSTGAIRSSPPVLIVCETKPVVFKSPQENKNSKIAGVMKVAQEARRVTSYPPMCTVVATPRRQAIFGRAAIGVLSVIYLEFPILKS